MNKIKIFFASFLWIVFFYFFKKYVPNILSENAQHFLVSVTKWLLSLVSSLSILMIIFGLIGYICNVHKINEKKQRKFKEMIFCGIIIIIITLLTYSMVSIHGVIPIS